MPCECCGRPWSFRERVRLWWERVSPKHRRERKRQEAEAKARYQQRKAREAEQERRLLSLRIEDVTERGGQPMLCSCRTHSSPDDWRETPNGYCRYCGGWTPEVYREHMGEEALQAKIDELALRDREKMRELVAAPEQHPSDGA